MSLQILECLECVDILTATHWNKPGKTLTRPFEWVKCLYITILTTIIQHLMFLAFFTVLWLILGKNSLIWFTVQEYGLSSLRILCLLLIWSNFWREKMHYSRESIQTNHVQKGTSHILLLIFWYCYVKFWKIQVRRSLDNSLWYLHFSLAPLHWPDRSGSQMSKLFFRAPDKNWIGAASPSS